MQLSVETVVWVALALVVVAVVGLFLMGNVFTASQQTSQKFYARLINSEYSPQYGGYIISVRVVNTGEGGSSINSLEFHAVGFSGDTVTVDADLSDSDADDTLSNLNLGPRESRDITVGVQSDYVSGEKALVIKATFDDGTTGEVSVTIP
ncbi:MAG: hypothetical protein J7J65_02010 [Candidatus Korarchaeota archaeon]|nr:hypothetical protein [Candidatus Korarchaeota archaeon]